MKCNNIDTWYSPTSNLPNTYIRDMVAVCLTIDVECSIGGAFSNTERLPQIDAPVWCRINGKSHGLGFILDTLSRHRLTATFFVETNHVHHFGPVPMQAAVDQIIAAGHTVQLHAHPCWSVFQYADWRSRCACPELDNFAAITEAKAVKLIEDGIAAFAYWNLPRPTVFRSGNLEHDRHLYDALAHCRIPYSSSIGLGIFDSDKVQYRLFSGHHRLRHTTELPITSFEDWAMVGKRRLKSLTIAGTTFSETVSLLLSAERQAVSTVVLLTHPFEFVHKRDVHYSSLRPNTTNQRRFEKLCAFLDEHRAAFPAVTVARAAADADRTLLNRNIVLRTSFAQSLGRKVSNEVDTQLGILATAFN